MASLITFRTPDLIISIAAQVESRKDLSVLNRCSRNIREHTLPNLYRELTVTRSNAHLLAAAIRTNRKYSRYCRKLSIVYLSSRWNPEEKRHQEFVVNKCLKRGLLMTLSWTVVGFSISDAYRSKKGWDKLPLVSQTLKTLSVALRCREAQVALVSPSNWPLQFTKY